jgi:CheY-like chemotaxis protein
MPNGPLIVVDDDLDDLTLIKIICRALKIPNEIILFEGAQQLLQFLRTTNQHPFLILCDINMPVMNGLELKKIIHDDPALKKKAIPFVFMSTAAMESQVDEAYSLTVQGFFEKGVYFETFKHTIKVIIEYWKECKHPKG